MALNMYFPHRCGRNYWDVWDWPQSVFGQHFGLDLKDLEEWMEGSSRGHKSKELVQRSGESLVGNTSDQFSVRLDCSHFTPEEIEVKTVSNSV
ncbi:unnamed protein product, partial [Oppiella nova]